MAQEEEIYDQGGYEDEIPMEGAEEGAHQSAEDLESLKQQLRQMEEEAARLKAMQAGASGEGAAAAAGASGAAAAAAAGTSAADIAAKEEVDARSIYVGSVDYACTPEELQQHFQGCGTVNRVTILTDQFGQPKGFAYVEFLEVDAVGNALLLDSTELRGRQIKVVQKRTNVPGLKRGRGRGRGGGRGGFGGRGGYDPYGGYGYGTYGHTPAYGGFGGRGRGGFHGGPPGGFAPRGRGRGRFSPY